MIKKRLSLSLVALIGSVFLFVIASFAWLVVTERVGVDENPFSIQNVDIEAVLYVSDDDITYIETTSISFENQVPGDVKYYKILLTNNNDFVVNTQVALYGYTNTYTDISGDTSNYTAGMLLADVVLLNSSNSVNADTITDQTLSSLLGLNTKIVTHELVLIQPSSTAELYFSFTMQATAGNDYQNLRLDFSNIFVQSFN